ncbi:MAG: hypothetical protein CMJ65_13235 [Planctomycetaceae bacterium]|nr:hypothetical protein [Planctomycetaceae bacterium]
MTPTSKTTDLVARGTVLAVFSSFCYTASIIALRDVVAVGVDWAAWISCLKAVPTVIIAAVVIAWQTRAGSIVWPSPRMIVVLLLTGTAMQLLGNVCFQLGLSLGGITMTVPLSQASLLISGAVLGLMMINERVSRRSIAAMMVLILAIAILSLDAGASTVSIAGREDPRAVMMTIGLGLAAGFGWGLAGVVIRQVATSGVSTAVTIGLLSSTAIVVLGGGVLARRGTEWIARETSTHEFWVTMLAGLFTAAAFFALTSAMRHITIVRANLLNASQISLTSLAGVLLFGEPFGRGMVVGTVLTVAGLLLMDRPQSSPEPGVGRRSKNP